MTERKLSERMRERNTGSKRGRKDYVCCVSSAEMFEYENAAKALEQRAESAEASVRELEADRGALIKRIKVGNRYRYEAEAKLERVRAVRDELEAKLGYAHTSSYRSPHGHERVNDCYSLAVGMLDAAIAPTPEPAPKVPERSGGSETSPKGQLEAAPGTASSSAPSAATSMPAASAANPTPLEQLAESWSERLNNSRVHISVTDCLHELRAVLAQAAAQPQVPQWQQLVNAKACLAHFEELAADRFQDHQVLEMVEHCRDELAEALGSAKDKQQVAAQPSEVGEVLWKVVNDLRRVANHGVGEPATVFIGRDILHDLADRVSVAVDDFCAGVA